MDIRQIILISLIMGAAALIQAALGIGFGMFASALLCFVVDPVTSAALTGVGVVVMGAQIVFRLRKDICYRISASPTITMTISKVLGIVLLMQIDPNASRIILGVLLILFSAYFCFLSEKVHIKPTPVKGALLGFAAGIPGGMFNLPGPIAAIYFFSAIEDKYQYAASINFAFLPGAAVGMLMHFWYGNLTVQLLPTLLSSCLMILLGGYAGLRILDRINKKQLVTALYVFMICIGGLILAT